MTLDRAKACQSNTLLVGVDGGASGYRAHEVVVRETAAGLRLALGEHSAAERIEELPEFEPLPIEVQREQARSGRFEFSRAESALQARWIHAATRSICRVASLRGCERAWVGVCTPGLKTGDGGGIALALNGPRIPDFADALEQSLSLEGLSLAEPVARLYSDGVACAWGEELAEGGLLAEVQSAYYVGGGSGVAEGYKLRGRIFGAEQLERHVQRAWQTLADDGRSFEVQLSARGINRDYRERAQSHDAALLGEDAAAAGDPRATSLFEERARHLAQWCFSRLTAIRNGQEIVLERIVIGQRLGQFFLDPRLQACFEQPARLRLCALLAESAAPGLRAAWLRDDRLEPGRLVGSALRAAPALGAMALAIEDA